MNPYFSLAQDWINTIDVDTFVMEYSSVQVETDDTVLLFFFFWWQNGMQCIGRLVIRSSYMKCKCHNTDYISIKPK